MVQEYLSTVERFVLPSSINKGERNNTLFKYACSLWAQGFSEGALEAELMNVATTRCNPPMTSAEVLGIINHVVSDYPQGLSAEYAAKRAEHRTAAFLDASKPSVFDGVGINDRELSHVFAELYRDRLRYVNEAKGWYAYDGIRWLPNTKGGNGKADMYIKDFVKQLQAWAVSIPDDDKRDKAMKAAAKYNRHRDRVGLLEDCKGELSESLTAFDKDTNLFNVLNGTLELRPFKMREHRAEDLITKVAGCSYDEGANAAEWESFLKRTFAGVEDLKLFLQARLALALAGDTGLECFYILYGEPRTGKSTFTETIKEVMGEYAHTTQPATFAKSQRKGEQASPDYADLFGKRFVVCPEPNEDMTLSADFLKQATGNDSITARQLQGLQFTFRPCFLLGFNTNYLPQTNDRTLFTSGRVVVVPFPNVVPEGERDPQLKKRLFAEETKSAVLNWLLRGLQVQDTFAPPLPTRCKNEVAKYASDSDRLGLFIEEHCELPQNNEGGFVQGGKELHDRYKDWCAENGFYPLNSTKFYNQLQRRGFEYKKRETVNGKQLRNVFYGIRLLPQQV